MSDTSTELLGHALVGLMLGRTSASPCTWDAVVDQRSAIAHQHTQLPNALRRQPDTRQVADAFEVGQQLRVAVIGFVRRLLEFAHVAWMRQMHRPAVFADELLSQVRRPGARLDRAAAHVAVTFGKSGDDPGMVIDVAIA